MTNRIMPFSRRILSFCFLVTILSFESLVIEFAAAANIRWPKGELPRQSYRAQRRNTTETSNAENVTATCAPEFFNTKHFFESGAAEWYVQWTRSIDKTSSAWTDKVSEPQYFATEQLRWMDMDCGVTHRGCINMPTCDDILKRVEGNRTLARNAYYVIQSYHNTNLIASIVSVSHPIPLHSCYYEPALSSDQKLTGNRNKAWRLKPMSLAWRVVWHTSSTGDSMRRIRVPAKCSPILSRLYKLPLLSP